MIEPSTYSEWSDCIDAIESGEQDDDVVLAMSRGTLNWNSGVATLFSERISGAFNVRLQRCADRMERDFKTGGDETTVVHAMLDTRRTLTLLHRVATIPSFPNMLREHLVGEIRRYAERVQQSLEDSAKYDRSGRLTSLMRNNSLLRYELAPESNAPAAQVPKAPEAVAAPAVQCSNEPVRPDVTSLIRSRPHGKIPLVAAAAVAAVCVLAGGAWFAMRGNGFAPSQTAAVVALAPTSPAPAPSKVAPVEPVPPVVSQAVNSVLATLAPPPRPSAEPGGALSKRVGVQPQDDSSKALALAAIVDEGEGCFNKKKFDCAISAAGSALRLDPGYARAVDLKRRAEAEQRRALDSISIN